MLCQSHRVCSCALKVFSSLRRLVFLKAPLASSLGLGAGAGADACSASLSSCTRCIEPVFRIIRLSWSLGRIQRLPANYDDVLGPMPDGMVLLLCFSVLHADPIPVPLFCGAWHP